MIDAGNVSAGSAAASVGGAVFLTGSLYVAEQAVSDAVSGRLGDTEKYVRKALAGSVVGFLTGASGLMMQGASLGKVLSLGFGEGFLGSTAEQGLLNEDGEINWALAIGDGMFSAVMAGLVWKHNTCNGDIGNENKGEDSYTEAIIISSSDEVVDFYGRPVSQRTKSILKKFQNAKAVEVVNDRGQKSIILVIENIKKRDVKVSDLGKLQGVTGKEYALFRGPNGQRVLIQGDPININIPYKYTGKGWKWSGHSHPYSARPSGDDRQALKHFEQEYSVIKSATGAEEYFKSTVDMSNWLPGMDL